MVTWFTSAPTTTTPYDTELFIDNQYRIFQYSLATTSWVPRSTFTIKKIRELYLVAKNHVVGADPFMSCPEVLDHDGALAQWISIFNGFFGKLFMKIFLIDLDTTYYRQFMNWSDWTAFVSANYPQGVGMWTSNCRIEFFAVVNNDLNITKLTGFNRLYGTARGRKGYYDKASRLSPVTDQNYEVSNSWHNIYWTDALTPNLGSALVTGILGDTISDPSNNNKAVWFACDRRKIYSQPNINSTLVFNELGRYVFDRSSNVFVIPSSNKFYVGSPYIIDTESAFPTLRVLNQSTDLRGSSYLYNRMNVIMVYPLYAESRPNEVAFLIKPYGVDHVSIHYTKEGSITYDVISESCKLKGKDKKWQTVTSNIIYDGQMFMVLPIQQTFVTRQDCLSGVNATTYPNDIKLFMFNSTNGMCGETSRDSIVLNKRKLNAGVCWEIKKCG